MLPNSELGQSIYLLPNQLMIKTLHQWILPTTRESHLKPGF